MLLKHPKPKKHLMLYEFLEKSEQNKLNMLNIFDNKHPKQNNEDLNKKLVFRRRNQEHRSKVRLFIGFNKERSF